MRDDFLREAKIRSCLNAVAIADSKAALEESLRLLSECLDESPNALKGVIKWYQEDAIEMIQGVLNRFKEASLHRGYQLIKIALDYEMSIRHGGADHAEEMPSNACQSSVP